MSEEALVELVGVAALERSALITIPSSNASTMTAGCEMIARPRFTQGKAATPRQLWLGKWLPQGCKPGTRGLCAC